MAIGVFYGGPSVEHDVSIVSALQLIEALGEGHGPVPVYLDREGRWWTGEALLEVASYGDAEPAGAESCRLEIGGGGRAALRVGGGSRLRRERVIELDAALCAIHGTGGEDGSLLGLLELAGIPYAGGPVGPAAVAMNKSVAKSVFAAAGIEVNPDVVVGREMAPAEARDRISAEVGLPCFVKPLSLGSSIGVSRCGAASELDDALELALELDRAALAEPALDAAIEINCAVLGRPGGELIVSLCEQPIKDGDDGLTFERKYLAAGGKGDSGKAAPAAGGTPAGDDATGSDRAGGAGGAKTGAAAGGMATADRIIPAPISEELTEQIQAIARRAHAALGFAGVVRYDFLVEQDAAASGSAATAPGAAGASTGARIVLNEANTVPGSFAYYLFDPLGITFPELASRLVTIAREEAAENRATTRVFDSMLLASYGERQADRAGAKS